MLQTWNRVEIFAVLQKVDVLPAARGAACRAALSTPIVNSTWSQERTSSDMKRSYSMSMSTMAARNSLEYYNTSRRATRVLQEQRAANSMQVAPRAPRS